MTVAIYEVVREWTTHAVLCDPCVAKRRKTGWTVRGRKLPPPAVFVLHVGDGPALAPLGKNGEVFYEGDRCESALGPGERDGGECQDCHLAALPACPTCGGPTIFPGAIGFNPCEDPAHVRTVPDQRSTGSTAPAPAEPSRRSSSRSRRRGSRAPRT